jgi:UDP-glucose 4-epimerase
VRVQGYDVRALDNERSGDWSRLTVPVERIDADLAALDEDELRALCAGADVVFHLAAEKHNASRLIPQRVIDVNISATRRLFESAARSGAGHVVFTSSLYAYGSLGPQPMRETDTVAPGTLYGISKVAGEGLLREMERLHGLSWTVARLFFVYGPEQYAAGGYKSVILANFERLQRGEAPTIYGDGRQALDYVYVDDAVDALLALADPGRSGTLVNVSSGRAISITELTSAMLRVAGSDFEPQHCPPDWTAGSIREGRPDLAAKTLGWRATTPIGSGLERVWAWLQRGIDAEVAVSA